MMAAIGATGDPANAYECGNTIGTYLNRYGFDIDFAPVADVNTNPENIVIGPRAFSDNPAVAAPMVTNYLQGLKDAGIVGCIQAGADIVLCSKDFIRAFNTIVKSVENGTITEERINQSVRRILKLKKQHE
jgi:beta-glucosidase-like glycosyl hydrolase